MIVAAVVLEWFGWGWVDPSSAWRSACSSCPRTWRLGRAAVRILVQAAPEHVDLAALAADLSAHRGVIDVHDLHVWTLTSDMDAASAHLMVGAGTDTHGVLDRARHLLDRDYRIAHATLQVEPETHSGCHSVTW